MREAGLSHGPGNWRTVVDGLSFWGSFAMSAAALSSGAGVLPTPSGDGRKLLAVALATVAALLLFNQFPSIDIAVSKAFFDPARCGWAPPGVPCTYFPAYKSKALETLRFGLQYFQFAVAAGLGIYLIMRCLRGEGLLSTGFASQLAAFLSYLICVGLVVNVVLKEHWGRPRPFQVDVFNGQWPMVPAGEISAFCETNCSFVSGEAAGAFWLVCFATLLPPRWRGAAIAEAFAIAFLTAYLRVSFGMHFLSDVVLSALLIVLTFVATRLAIVSLAGSPASRSRRKAGSGQG